MFISSPSSLGFWFFSTFVTLLMISEKMQGTLCFLFMRDICVVMICLWMLIYSLLGEVNLFYLAYEFGCILHA